MNRILSTILLTGVLSIAAAGSEAEAPDDTSAEARIRAAAAAIAAPDHDVAKGTFCNAWRRLEADMPFDEAEALGIDMNGSCTPGKPQSFHQPYMDLYFDAECRALHGATTLDC
jgi:hypothetical protein